MTQKRLWLVLYLVLAIVGGVGIIFFLFINYNKPLLIRSIGWTVFFAIIAAIKISDSID